MSTIANTYGLTTPRALYVRTIRADGSVSRLYDEFRRSPRVHNGVLVLDRKGKLFPIVAIAGDVADVRLDAGIPYTGDVNAVAPVWRADAPKQAPKGAAAQAPAKGSPEAKAKMAALRERRGQPKAPAQAPVAAPAQTPDVTAMLGAVMAQLNSLAQAQAATEARMAAFLSAPRKRG